MMGGTLGSRLARVEATEHGRRAAMLGGPALLLVYPESWPPEELAAFDGDDSEERANVIERQAGVRPGPATRIFAIRVRSDGPQ